MLQLRSLMADRCHRQRLNSFFVFVFHMWQVFRNPIAQGDNIKFLSNYFDALRDEFLYNLYHKIATRIEIRWVGETPLFP